MSRHVHRVVALSFLLACTMLVQPVATQSPAAGDRAGAKAMAESVLVVGNFGPGSPTDAILRYSGAGRFIDALIPAGAMGLTSTCCVTFGPDGHLYVSDPFGGRVLRFHGLTGTYLGEFITPGSGGLFTPLLVVFRDGYAYVGDLGDIFNPAALPLGAIRRYDADSGAFVDVFVEDDPANRLMGVFDPQHFAFAPDGTLYIAAEYANRILRVDEATRTLEVFLPASSGFTRPSGLTFGPDGRLYVGSVDRSEIRRFDFWTGMWETFVPSGSGGLNTPVGIAFGPDGHLYATSTGSSDPLAYDGAILRYDGRSGASRGALVPLGLGGLSGPRTLSFAATATVCHVPKGNPARAKTLTIGYMSALDHLAHGDEPDACR
ncbi:NHL repeat-containing protein [Luteitalea sp.]|uniref:Vgb family protein n=1 Tax=Luteitalea sp. TaxID=2004800 RepID=UPI000AEF15F2|nr:NHL repeat-containing protein [Luteitalea sp.]